MSKHNNRDHRKLLVIDGEIAYTGGLNLSDEYVNLVELYGRWKDSGVRICGECASRFADMFLSLWRLNSERSAKRKDRHVLQSSVKAENAITSEASASSIYIESSKGVRGESSGALVPFGTAPRPFFKRSAGRELFLNIINGAVDHIYLTTPYFIPDSELLGALGRAAARGVDVRIVIPGVPDKRLIKWIGEGYFPALIGAGVRIYEYSPGFIHSKCIVCDGRSAVVGSLNLDYRSLAHNFENGVLIMENGAVAAARDDVLSTVSISHELSLCDLHPSLIKRAARLIAGVVLPIL